MTAATIESPADATQKSRAPGVHLETQRLVLRDIKSDDIDALLAQGLEPQSFANILRGQRNPVRIANWLRMAVTYVHLVPVPQREIQALTVVRRADGELLGHCTLRFIERGGVIIGWHYGVAHAGQGYATEAARALLRFAFDDLGMERAYADCFTTNAAVIAVLGKLGMRRASGGILREWLRGLGYRELRPSCRHVLHRDELPLPAAAPAP